MVWIVYSNAIIMLHIFSLAIESCQICSWHARRNAIFLRQMHLFVNNMADPDISDYEFDADDHNCIVFENFMASIGDLMVANRVYCPF